MFDQTINSYEEAHRLAHSGRSRDGGSPGAKVSHNTYLFDRGNYVALQFHKTDIVEFHPEHVVLATGIDTKTTKERVEEFTKLHVGTLSSAKEREYRLNHTIVVPRTSDGSTPRLEYKDGLHFDYDGRWVPQHQDEGRVRMMLPRPGTRSQAYRVVRRLRAHVKPHVSLLWQDGPKSAPRMRDKAVLRALEFLAQGYRPEDMDAAGIEQVVDQLLAYRHQYDTPTQLLRGEIQPSWLITQNLEGRDVPWQQAEELLATRAPEWPD